MLPSRWWVSLLVTVACLRPYAAVTESNDGRGFCTEEPLPVTCEDTLLGLGGKVSSMAYRWTTHEYLQVCHNDVGKRWYVSLAMCNRTNCNGDSSDLHDL